MIGHCFLLLRDSASHRSHKMVKRTRDGRTFLIRYDFVVSRVITCVRVVVSLLVLYHRVQSACLSCRCDRYFAHIDSALCALFDSSRQMHSLVFYYTIVLLALIKSNWQECAYTWIVGNACTRLSVCIAIDSGTPSNSCSLQQKKKHDSTTTQCMCERNGNSSRLPSNEHMKAREEDEKTREMNNKLQQKRKSSTTNIKKIVSSWAGCSRFETTSVITAAATAASRK